jgi:hypothetical protein
MFDVAGLTKRDAQRLGDRSRDLVLDHEHVVDVAIEALGPQVIAVGDVHQLRADAQAVAGLADAALEHRLHVQSLADLAHVDLRALELERRGPRHDRQPLDAGERADQLLGHPVAEILLVGIVGQVGEGQHGDRRQARDRRRRQRHAAHQGAQVSEQIGDALITPTGLPRRRACNDAIEIGRGAADGRDGTVQQRNEHDSGVRPFERTLAGRHLVDEDAERKDVAARVDRISHQLLGRHVGERADDLALARLLDAWQPRRLDVLGEAEVEHLHAAVGADHDIGRLEVAMDDPPGVRRGERLGDGNRNRQQLVELESARRNQPVERRPLHQLHRDEGNVVRFLDGVNGDDIGMVQRRDGARFTGEAAAVLAVVGLENFQRDVALEARIAGPVDLAHTPDAEEGNDFVRPQALAWQ